MKLEIYDRQVKPERRVFLRLVPHGREGEFILEACDERGETHEQGSLFRISPEGVLRYRDVNPKLGFELDELGAVVDLEN